MSSREKNIPKRRFMEFQKGEEWEERKLGDLCKLQGGYAFRSQDFKNEGVKVVQIGNVYANDLIWNNIVKFNTEKISNYTDYFLKKDDLVIAMTRPIIQSLASVKIAKITEKDLPCLLNQRVGRFRLCEKLDTLFLKNFTETDHFYKNIFERSSSGVQPNISSSDVENINITLPLCKKEQEKIGLYFSNIDNLITLNQHKLDKLKVLKKAYLDQMFPSEGESKPKLRFVRFKDEWEEKKLNELCSIVTKQTGFDYTSTIKKSLLTTPKDNTLPYMQTKNFSGINFDYNTDYYIPINIANQFEKIILNKKCLLFSIVGASVGNIAYFPNTIKCFLSGAICVAKPIDEDETAYLYYFICSSNGQQQIKTATKGSGQATVTIEDIRKFNIKLPLKLERCQIAKFLYNLDKLIILQQLKLEKLQNIKKAYLNEMFV